MKSLTIHQRVHLLALVGSLAGFVDLKSDVARCPKHVFDNNGIFSKIRKFSVIVFDRRCVPYAIVESFEMKFLFTIVFKNFICPRLSHNDPRKVVLALSIASGQYNLPWAIMTNLGHITGPL
jgi:hypothetical protein